MYTCFLDSPPPKKKVYTCLPFSKPIFIPFNLFAQYSFMSKAVRSVGNSNSVTMLLGDKDNQDAHGLSAKDPSPRLWISICNMPKDVDTL